MKHMDTQRCSHTAVSQMAILRSWVVALMLLLPFGSMAQFLQQTAKLSGADILRPVQQGTAVAVSADGSTAVIGGANDGFTGAVWVFIRQGNTWVQEGEKLIGSGTTGATNTSMGVAVAISADGNTILVGGPSDGDMTGAAWVFTRTHGVWSQQGEKLVGTGGVGQSAQGISVALSADGNTALVGGTLDDGQSGATWVFVRVNGIWKQQGPKLVGTDGYEAIQGSTVALSADGNTAVIGGPNDWNYTGAAWVFTRKNGVWSQQGPKLFGAGAIEDVGLQFGRAVAISGDGNTLMVSGPWDNYWTGAAWIFTRDGTVWTQQGDKLVGAGATDYPFQGFGVGLSYDGNTAVSSSYSDGDGIGAAWVFTRDGDGAWSQVGEKLVGTGAEGQSYQGWSAALSADGNTLLVGAPFDNNSTGATWVFTRKGGDWTQMGEKLVGSGGTGYGFQGYSVALSADGNTALVGGYYENYGTGATWVYVRDKGIWRQQGPKLIGTGGEDLTMAQGFYSALSADGNTALVGGPWDNANAGAAWVFIRQNGVWSQQGQKLVGAGAIGAAYQGRSVALSADGNTAIVCGPRDNSNTGAAWVFIRQNGQWVQQGKKLTASGALGNPYLGRSAALSADGNTAIISGTYDNGNAGAAWIFTRQNGTWTQQGQKLIGSGAVGKAGQGVSVSISADGNTAMVGATADNNNTGAAWVFTRQNGIWTQQAEKLVGTGSIGTTYQGIAVSLSADGNKALVGGYYDDDITGALWVFTRQNGVWTQQGEKITVTGAINKSGLGYSAALSADGTTAIAGGIFENSSEGAAWVFSVPACDIKGNDCLTYEVIGITEDALHRKTYDLRVTNHCDNRLSYLAIQLPDGLTAKVPDNDAFYTSPAGRRYLVRNPNYSPFYSLRFATAAESLPAGASELFRYTLPAQADVSYIHIIAKLEPQTWNEAYLNVFECPVEQIPAAQPPAASRSTAFNGAGQSLQLYPSPTDGKIWINLVDWPEQNLRLEVLDAQGQQVQTLQFVAGRQIIPLELHQRLPNGIYWICLTPEQGSKGLARFVLQR